MDQKKKMDKPTLLDSMQKAKTDLDAALTGLNEEQVTESGKLGEWSHKDNVAHIVGWERKLVEWLQAISLRETLDPTPHDLTWDEIHRANAQFVAEHATSSWEELLADHHRHFQAALEILESLPQEALLDPDYLEWYKGQPFWSMVAACTYIHFREHIENFQ
jgi:hypothetical protein